ncbi:MAG: hypothetical protein M9962_03595 [Oligoflexia bacterium]|nr:hypothetical protein [Oligoflexia bacterium]
MKIYLLFALTITVSSQAFAEDEMRAPPSCYLTATVYKNEKRIQDNGQIELRIPTKRIEVSPNREDCRVDEIETKLSEIPFTLRMRYRAFCGPSGISFEGSLGDEGYNILYYSKHDPSRVGGYTSLSQAYFTSRGKSYSLSLTCF